MATQTSSTSASRTNYIASNFPYNPFQTSDFDPPSSCSGIYLDTGGRYTIDAIFTIGNDRECLPKRFSAASTAFYSPGTACPTGYTAQPQCSRNDGVRTITTVTCCPYSGDMTLACIEDSLPRPDRSELQFCTWMAGVKTIVNVTLSESAGGSLTTTGITLTGSEGVNAYGIRYVYQASDLGPASTTESTSTGKVAGQTSSADGGSTVSKGLSTDGIIAVAVVVSVVTIAAVVGLLSWWRHRKRHSMQPEGETQATVPVQRGPNAAANLQELAGQSQLQGGGTQVQVLNRQGNPMELPAEYARR
ncbi:hypothetical protein IL306_006995 [Fusarium sp. DS 682]|nr:hypothetical protein IL306_006995 [Fusarium sp. DS 682]